MSIMFFFLLLLIAKKQQGLIKQIKVCFHTGSVFSLILQGHDTSKNILDGDTSVAWLVDHNSPFLCILSSLSKMRFYFNPSYFDTHRLLSFPLRQISSIDIKDVTTPFTSQDLNFLRYR